MPSLLLKIIYYILKVIFLIATIKSALETSIHLPHKWGRGGFKLWILITINYCWQHAYFTPLPPKKICVSICTKQTFICSKWEILEIEIKNKITITTSFWYVEFEHVFIYYIYILWELALILLNLINISTSIVIGFWR